MYDLFCLMMCISRVRIRMIMSLFMFRIACLLFCVRVFSYYHAASQCYLSYMCCSSSSSSVSSFDVSYYYYDYSVYGSSSCCVLFIVLFVVLGLFVL